MGFAVDCVRHHFGFVVDHAEHNLIEGVWAIQIVDGHAVLLADSVCTVFRLIHDGWCPGQLGKNHSGGSGESDTLRAGGDAQNSNFDVFVTLKLVDSCMSLLGRNPTVNLDMLNFLLGEVLRIFTYHFPMVTKE